MTGHTLYYSAATVSVNQRPLDFSGNRQRIIEALKFIAARVSKKNPKNELPNLILFPELCVSGYGCEDAFHSLSVIQDALKSTQKIARQAGEILPSCVVVVGLPFSLGGGLYNCCAVLANGRLTALVPKTNLAGDGVHYETRWFCAFTQKTVRRVSLPSFEKETPQKQEEQKEETVFGLTAFSHRGVRFIIENCRDAWGPARPADALRDSDFDIVLNPSASHFALDKYKMRRSIILESSRRLNAAFILTNPLGCEGGKLIYDGHMAAASQGQLESEEITFSFEDFRTAFFTLDLGPNRVRRAQLSPSEKKIATTETACCVLEISSSATKEKSKPSEALSPVLLTEKLNPTLKQ